MNPSVWGKYQWAAIHFSALGYPNDPSTQMKNTFRAYFTEILPSVLPCEACRNHLRQTLANELPLTNEDLRNSETLFKWTVKLHNIVNQRLHKPEVTLEEAIDIFMSKSKLDAAMFESKNTPTSAMKESSPTTPVSITIIDSKINSNNLQHLLITFFLMFMMVLYVYYFKFSNIRRMR